MQVSIYLTIILTGSHAETKVYFTDEPCIKHIH